MLLLLVLAFGLRVAWWMAYVDVIENEGALVARIAENWMQGNGLVSIFGGRDVMSPPLFVALLGLVSTLTGSTELAGRLIGIAAGTGLVAILAASASLLFNKRAGLIVGFFAAVHPLLLALSVSLYSEGLWITLVFSAAYLVLLSLSAPSVLRLSAAGLLLGSAYLVRPEGAVFLVLLAVTVFVAGVARGWQLNNASRRAGALLLAGLLVALPYAGYLSALAGDFHWEGKSAYNNVQNERIRAGMTVPQAARGLDAKGNPVGVFLNLHEDQAGFLGQQSNSSDGMLRNLLADPVVRVLRIPRMIVAQRFLSAPWILLLVAIGVVVTWTRRDRRWPGAVLLAIFGMQCGLLLSVDQLWNRYFFTLCPLLILWAGGGIEWLASRISTLAPLDPDGRPARLLAGSFSVAICLLLAAIALPSVRHVGELAQAGDRTSKEIGKWIAADAAGRQWGQRPVIMGITLASAYYAGGTMRYLPYASEDLALAYIRRMKPQYLVLRDTEEEQAPYAADWLKRGIRDECAVIARDRWLDPLDKSRVWHWRC